MERLNRMAYNRLKPPYSPGTHLTGRAPERGTPAAGPCVGSLLPGSRLCRSTLLCGRTLSFILGLDDQPQRNTPHKWTKYSNPFYPIQPPRPESWCISPNGRKNQLTFILNLLT